MDLTKPSFSSKTTNNGGGNNEGPVEEAAEQCVDGTEADVTGWPGAAETAVNQQGAEDKQRFNTFSYQRRTKQKVVRADCATVSKGASASAKPRAALIQVLFSQGGSDRSSMSEERGLEELKQALQAFLVPVSLSWCWGEEGRGAALENSWTEIVHSHPTMSKTQRHQQEALWEFVHTELAYINKLTVITDLVMAALTNLHQHGFLLEISHKLLFSNLPAILAAHRQFWQEVMYPMLQEVRRTGKPFDPLRLEAGCLQFHERFSSYLHYCWEEENTVEFTRKQLETNPHFHTYLTWVETHPQCERMRLGDMQAKPHQRVTKYPLLIKAVLKTTQDPRAQNTLQRMLSSVNGFLDGINDYLRLKDEDLALTLSAQRLDGYDVMEGMNEEIEKHVREICRFDLMCPIRGAGPGVIRKLLLEETLKIRGRKDCKLEVVALLFSDVLLVTKVQKKAEKLKVVRPPLALDRTCGVALKDGCSFVLVEVSDLGCAVNVYSFSASSPESCSTWLSTIQQAQETLKALRQSEVNRLRGLEANQRHPLFEITPITEITPSESELSNESTEEKYVNQLELETSVEVKPVEEPITIQSVNGKIAAMVEEAELERQATGLTDRQRKFSDTRSQSVHGDFAGWPQKNGQRVEAMDEMESSEVRWHGGNGQWEEEYGIDVQAINERRVTWNHHPRSTTSDPSDSLLSNRVTAGSVSKGTPSLFPREYPDVDYPQSHEARTTQGGSGSESDSRGIRGTGSRLGVARQDAAERDSCYSQSAEEEEARTEAWRFSRKLKSPRLQRRRPVNGQQGGPPQMSRRGSESELARSAAHTHPSNSHYADQSLRPLSASSRQSSDPHLVLRLGSLKLNRGEFWTLPSETELPKEMPDQTAHKKHRMRTQRSVSNPNLAVPDPLLTGRPPIGPAAVPHSPPPGPRPRPRPSPLEGLLERARERRRGDGGRRGREGQTHAPPAPPALPAVAPSRSLGEGRRETQLEEAGPTRGRAGAVSEGWREARGDGDERKKSPVFVDGASVDWQGWCFDDREVMDHLGAEDAGAGDEGLLEGIRRTLTLRDLQLMAEQEDVECSQV